MAVSPMKSSSSMVEDISSQQIDVLHATDDPFGGVRVEMEPINSNDFDTLLRTSISQWREQGKKGIWLKLPITLANLVEAAVKQGFWYHHAEPTYLMLAYWIPRTAHTLPANASHTVGVGAFIMNNKREIKAEFMELLAVRQSHDLSFGKSDLYFVCMLRPFSFNIQKQESEIAAAKWMVFEEYAAQPYIQQREHFNYVAKICAAKIDYDYIGFCALPATRASSQRKKSCLYFNNTGALVVPDNISSTQ